MDTQHQHTGTENVDNEADIELNKPSKSRFLFLLGFFGFFIFCWAGCYNLWQHQFNKSYEPKVPESTQYDPKYK